MFQMTRWIPSADDKIRDAVGYADHVRNGRYNEGGSKPINLFHGV